MDKDKMKEIKFYNTDAIVCPHCTHIFENSEEVHYISGEIPCEECEKTFYFTRHTKITYFTSAKIK